MKKIKWFVLMMAVVSLTLLATGCSSKHHGSSSPTGSEEEVATGDTSEVTQPDSDTVVAPPVAKKGFSLVMTSPEAAGLTKRGLTKQGVVVATGEESTDFFMGVIRERREYQYLLTNNSDKQLTGVSITSSNPKFLATPTSIRSIGVPTQGVGASVLVQVMVLHGESAGGSWAPPVTESEATTTLVITGNYGDSAFTVSYTIGVTPAYVEVQGDLKAVAAGSFTLVGHSCPITYLVGSSGEKVVSDTLPAVRNGTPSAVFLSDNMPAVFYSDCVVSAPGVHRTESELTLKEAAFPL